jgi:hypothetical protein
MKKILYFLPIIVLLAAGCSSSSQNKTQSPTPTDISQTPPPPTPSETSDSFFNYINKTYHFSLSVPKEEYAGQCDESEPVKITEKTNVITIGTNFDHCPDISPSFLNGWTIYAADNISSQKDAQMFLDKELGKGCSISEWGNHNATDRTENQPNAFFIDSLNQTSANPFGDCQFSGEAKYRTFYSPELKTMVFWSLTQEIEFPSKTGENDDQVLNSFKFVK